MTARRESGFDLAKAALDPGFTPRVRDAGPLVDLLVEGGEQAGALERALLRIGPAAAPIAIARAQAMEPAGRATVLRWLGRLAAAHPDDPAAAAFLIECLADPDERVRRAAAVALGKARPAQAEEALAEALGREGGASARRAIVEALGKVGGERARAALAAAGEEQGEVAERTRAKASLIVTRELVRAEASSIDAQKTAPRPTLVALRCRAGLEGILAAELPPDLAPRIEQSPPGGERVEVTLRGAPIDLFRARTMLSFGFPLPPARVRGGDFVSAIAQSLASPEALAILKHWTSGPIRYRIAWAGGGKRRAAVWRIAEEVARRRPEIVNDPTGSPWEAVVYEEGDAARVELVPSVPDERFAYRRGDVPAASHPTIAAALVHIAGIDPADVVWDPFVGSGVELCERSLAGPYRGLVGSDLEQRALSTARMNLTAAGARNVTLLKGDATSLVPPGGPPTLVITNPPMGRRVQRTADLGPMLDRFLAHAADLLAPGGRLVWISPFPQRTLPVAERLGLVPALVRPVDMGGFWAEIQALRKPLGR